MTRISTRVTSIASEHHITRRKHEAIVSCAEGASIAVDIYHATAEDFASAFVEATSAGTPVKYETWYVDTMGDYDGFETSAYFRVKSGPVTIIHRHPRQIVVAEDTSFDDVDAIFAKARADHDTLVALIAAGQPAS